ncbi:MAG: hypothetical protein VB858_18350, partial [Planctomycetaceae bacterium]
MGIPVKSTDSVDSALEGIQSSSDPLPLSAGGQSAREFLTLDELMGDLVSASHSREVEDRQRSRIEQYSHPSRVPG